MIKYKTIFGFAIIKKSDFEKMRCELEHLRRLELEKNLYMPLYFGLSSELDDAKEQIKKLEKYKKLFADEVQKRLELIKLMEDKHDD